MSPLRETITQNLQYFREQAGLSQQELSRRCGFDETYLGKIERGHSDPSMEVLLRVAQELDFSPRRLIRRNQPELSPPSSSTGPISRGVHPFDDLVRKINRPMAIVSQEGVVLDANPALREYRALESDEPVGKLLWKLSMWDFQGDGEEQIGTHMQIVFEQNVSMLLKVVSEQMSGSNPFRLILGSLKHEESAWSYATLEILEPGPESPLRISLRELEVISRW